MEGMAVVGWCFGIWCECVPLIAMVCWCCGIRYLCVYSFVGGMAVVGWCCGMH